MIIDVITLFPEMFAGPFDTSIIKRARDQDLITINFRQLRDWAIDKRGTVDGSPYGGGVGMVLRVEPIAKALQELRRPESYVVLMTPQGQIYDEATAQKLSLKEHLILICGHYEGFDERIRSLVDAQISIGKYILTGGEIPAMTIVDSVVRLIPKVLTKPEATMQESFSDGDNLEYPQYTRPEDYNGQKVPEILLSGNHSAIKKWRLLKRV
ncbi:MAG: tRNA (guanosine(37)-N1)-methyltransferase TrmD [candidate division WWE3 bacterium]|nr:tRNA (guanosine(37)-N1)-methyltransferase TrmD [candidate division WWE3 bacterium]